jgi:5-methyltetrahydrofolate--homocysteine methyltransferase
VVNSILKEGEEQFIHHAKLIKRYGAAVIVMAFDEGTSRYMKDDVLKFVSVRMIFLVGIVFHRISSFDLKIFSRSNRDGEHRLNALDLLEEPSGFEKIYHTHIVVV